MFIKTPLLLFRQLPDVFLTMVKSFLYAKNKAKKYKRKRKKAKREREKKKGKKDKAGKTERAGKRRTENDKEQNGQSHKFSQLRTIRAVFFIQKSPSHVKRVFFGCEAIFT